MTNSEAIDVAKMRGGRGNRAFQIRETIREHGAMNHRQIAEKLGVTDPKEIRSIQTIASRMACSGMLVREPGKRPRAYSLGRKVNDMFVHSPEVYRQRARERHTAFMREYRRRKRAEATPEQAAAYREKRSRVRAEARTKAAIRAAHLVCAKPRLIGRKPEPEIVAAPPAPAAKPAQARPAPAAPERETVEQWMARTGQQPEQLQSLLDTAQPPPKRQAGGVWW